MRSSIFPALRIGELRIPRPIIQGGMGAGISMAGLAASVANVGGMGVISSVGLGGLDPEPSKSYTFEEANKRALCDEIRKARKMSDGVIAVNVMLALTDCDNHIEIAIQEGADAVIMGAGLPIGHSNIFSYDKFRSTKTKFIPKISSARAARLIFRYWASKYNHIPDAVIVEGPLAGGHLGFTREQISDPAYALENLVPEVINTIAPFANRFEKEIPVIAAGGIYNTKDIRKFFDLGARGVGLGTRFVATYECDACDNFKKLYIACKENDIIIIDSPLGLPGRVIKNKFINDVNAGKKKPFRCLWKCLHTCDFDKTPYCVASALLHAKLGDFTKGFAFAGANAYRIERITSVKELFLELLC